MTHTKIEAFEDEKNSPSQIENAKNHKKRVFDPDAVNKNMDSMLRNLKNKIKTKEERTFLTKNMIIEQDSKGDFLLSSNFGSKFKNKKKGRKKDLKQKLPPLQNAFDDAMEDNQEIELTDTSLKKRDQPEEISELEGARKPEKKLKLNIDVIDSSFDYNKFLKTHDIDEASLTPSQERSTSQQIKVDFLETPVMKNSVDQDAFKFDDLMNL